MSRKNNPSATEHDLACALLASPESFFAARDAGIGATMLQDYAVRSIWLAAERAVAASESPDAATLLSHGAPQAELVSILGTNPTTLGLRAAIRAILNADRRKRVLARVERVKELAEADSTLAEAEETLLSPLEGAQGRGLGPVTAARDLCAKPPATPPQLIEGVLYAGGTVMLSGPSKAHKTYTFLGLGLAVASGAPWLGFKTSKSGVLYLNFELPEFAFQHRLAAICKATGIAPPDNFHSLNLRGKTATMAMLSAELPRLIKSRGIGLVVLDPWYKVAANSGAEENSNDGQARILAEAERIVTTNGAALIVGHHFAKGDASSKNSIDRAAGAGAMARWGDVIATLTEHEEEDAMALEMHLRCFAPVPPVVLRWQHPVWIRDPKLDPSRLRKAGRVDAHPAAKALEALKNGMTAREWREALDWPESTFRRKRDELMSTGKVVQESGAFYRTDR